MRDKEKSVIWSMQQKYEFEGYPLGDVLLYQLVITTLQYCIANIHAPQKLKLYLLHGIYHTFSKIILILSA